MMTLRATPGYSELGYCLTILSVITLYQQLMKDTLRQTLLLVSTLLIRMFPHEWIFLIYRKPFRDMTHP